MLKENIDKIVRYCRQYQAHGYMMDERNLNDGFNVELPEEKIHTPKYRKASSDTFYGRSR